MKLTTALLALLLAIPAFAQQKPASTIPPTPPTAAAKPLSPDTVKKIEAASKATDTANKKIAEAEKAVTAEVKRIPPVISDALRAQFFKAQSQMIQANAQAQQRQSEFQSSVAELQKTCGDKYTLQLNGNGDPECVARPTPTTK
jgi:septal ring-binding cell division protein DamX